jgi:hypothetical protein
VNSEPVTSTQKTIRSFIANWRLLFIAAILIVPMVILHMLISQPSSWFQQDRDYAVNRDYPFLNLKYMIESTEELIKKSESMTPTQYEQLLKLNPQFPPTLEGYRGQLKVRLAELHKMSEADLSEEMSEKISPLQWSDDAASDLLGMSTDTQNNNVMPAKTRLKDR